MIYFAEFSSSAEHILHYMLSLLAVVEDGTVIKNSHQAVTAPCGKIFRTMYIHFHPILNVSSLIFQVNSCGPEKLCCCRLFGYDCRF